MLEIHKQAPPSIVERRNPQGMEKLHNKNVKINYTEKKLFESLFGN